jgi:hypothetical protein
MCFAILARFNEGVNTMMATTIKMMEMKAGPERMKEIEGTSSKPEDEEAQHEEVQDPGRLSE